ncbi:MAG: Crp/Fnr family transcriptional regulator [Proteobacteria bacterium]|nr:Crp/Fnr family transcriptional regulator [Pseudomonadota bacterium]
MTRSDLTAAGGLPPSLAARFVAASSRRRLVAGEELFGLGSMPQAMFGVLAGRVQVSIYAADGRQLLAAVLGQGQWFGEVPLLDGVSRAFRAEALAAAEVAVLSAPAFWRLVGHDAQALLAVTRLVCHRYRQALAWIEDASLRPLSARLAARLLAQAQTAEPLRLPQEALAAQLGVSRQRVNRQLKAWEAEGLVELGYASVRIRDPAPFLALSRHPA